MGIFSVVTFLLSLAIPLVGQSEPVEVPTCMWGPTQKLGNNISFLVGKIANRSGFVCVRVFNGTKENISYGLLDLGLERRWLWMGWTSALRLRDFFPSGRGMAKDWRGTVKPGESYDHILPFHGPAPPGQYKVRFHYLIQGEEHTVYSEEFVLP